MFMEGQKAASKPVEWNRQRGRTKQLAAMETVNLLVADILAFDHEYNLFAEIFCMITDPLQ